MEDMVFWNEPTFQNAYRPSNLKGASFRVKIGNLETKGLREHVYILNEYRS